MLSVHKKYKELIQDVFNGDQSFIGALDKACASAVNHRPNPKMTCRSPEMVGMIYDKNIQ
jgi:cullin 2